MTNSSASDLPFPDQPTSDLAVRPLTVPLLVRGSFDSGCFVVLCVIAGVCFFLGLLTLNDRDPSSVRALWGLALLIGLPCLIFGLWMRRQRRWLEVSLTGFVLSSKDERRVYRDDQIVALSQTFDVSPEGKQHRRLVLEIAANEGIERIDCRYTVASGQVDPLSGFLERLSAGLVRRIESLPAGSERFRGQNWRLDEDTLHAGRERISLSEITWAGFYDRHLCVWRGEEERPCVRIPAESLNVRPLSQILSSQVAKRPEHDNSPDSLPLGRLLLERKAWGFLVGWLVALVFLVCCSVLVWLTMREDVHRRDRPRYVGFAVACFCGAAGGAITCWRGRRGGIRFYEKGVRQSSRRGFRELLYSEIGQVIWKSDSSLTFRPKLGLDRPTIRYRPLSPGVDLELAAMRDLACRPLASSWLEKQPHTPLTWTPNLRFLPGGLEYRPTGLLLKGDPVSVPFDLTSYRFDGDYFLLLVGEKDEQGCKERVTHPNFFVGLLVLSWIYERCKQQSLPDAGERAPRASAQSAAHESDERIVEKQSGSGHIQGEQGARSGERDD